MTEYKTLQELEKEAENILIKFKNRFNLTVDERKSIPPQEMPRQKSEERIKNFNEVAIGYSKSQAIVEAMRCLGCKKAPCIKGCPVRVNIPVFIRYIVEEEFDKAISVIKETNLLPAVCGRVCPQETQCQANCTLGKMLGSINKSVSIGRLERFVADMEAEKGDIKSPPIGKETGKKVAVIGSGPGGITVAADVRRRGHAVNVFEALHKAGGVLVYGIPEFRLPKSVVQREIDCLKAMGVDIVTDFVIGRTRTIKQLIEEDGYDAVYIGTGAGLPKFLGVEGENLVGVYSANEYLTRANLMRAYDTESDTPILRGRRIAVFGGGNVAMDAARTALRLGAEEVYLIYRRGRNEMPARYEEVENAMEEGVKFHFLCSPVRFIGDENGRVCKVECLRYILGEPDDSGRPRPVPVKDSEFMMDIDVAVIAIGNEPNPLISRVEPELKVDARNRIIVDERYQTSIPRVYAGGDVVSGAATVISAMRQGRCAAISICEDIE